VTVRNVLILACLIVSVGCLSARRAPTPLVVFLDSRHPARVYDSTTIAGGCSNAELLSESMGELPIRPLTEVISPDWHREDALLRLEPDLVVIHYSGFCEARCDDRSRLRDLIERFAETPTHILVYSRLSDAELRHGVDSLLAATLASHAGLRSHLMTFGLNDHGSPHWTDPATLAALKARIRESLGL